MVLQVYHIYSSRSYAICALVCSINRPYEPITHSHKLFRIDYPICLQLISFSLSQYTLYTHKLWRLMTPTQVDTLQQSLSSAIPWPIYFGGSSSLSFARSLGSVMKMHVRHSFRMAVIMLSLYKLGMHYWCAWCDFGHMCGVTSVTCIVFRVMWCGKFKNRFLIKLFYMYLFFILFFHNFLIMFSDPKIKYNFNIYLQNNLIKYIPHF